jgi:hypothetical protein
MIVVPIAAVPIIIIGAVIFKIVGVRSKAKEKLRVAESNAELGHQTSEDW